MEACENENSLRRVAVSGGRRSNLDFAQSLQAPAQNLYIFLIFSKALFALMRPTPGLLIALFLWPAARMHRRPLIYCKFLLFADGSHLAGHVRLQRWRRQ